ncbi:DUF418 domain-containing protein [Paenibacillus tuaregi]|uniref:DUF418 domain-containing protein n=1 Tax=Paenibacillus tuaregi TaxID=1816681 RepID=UPI000839467F|nr:DUF418 domain-containing protein [Paenibacillus tuaregi]
MGAERITGLDLARALSIFGMIIVNFKISMTADQGGPNWLIGLAGLFEGRASAVFVVLAGFGFTLMTRRARAGDQEELSGIRRVIWKRSVYLALLGSLLLWFGWTADILHYYAVFLFMASFLIRAQNWLLAMLTGVLVVGGQLLQFMMDYTRGWDGVFHAYTEFWTLPGFLRNLGFNGFHPVVPWFAFFLMGMLLGRSRLSNMKIRRTWMLGSLAALCAAETLSIFAMKIGEGYIGREAVVYLFQTKPMPPNFCYMISSISSAIVFILFCMAVTEFSPARRLVGALTRTGQMALTHYVMHIIIGLGILELLGILENGSLSFAVIYSVGYFIVVVFLSVFWGARFTRGPLEAVMRKL